VGCSRFVCRCCGQEAGSGCIASKRFSGGWLIAKFLAGQKATYTPGYSETIMTVQSSMKPVTVRITCMLYRIVVVGKYARQSSKSIHVRLLHQVIAIPNIATLIRLCHTLYSKS